MAELGPMSSSRRPAPISRCSASFGSTSFVDSLSIVVDRSRATTKSEVDSAAQRPNLSWEECGLEYIPYRHVCPSDTHEFRIDRSSRRHRSGNLPARHRYGDGTPSSRASNSRCWSVSRQGWSPARSPVASSLGDSPTARPERRRRIASSFGAFAMTVLVTIVAGLLLPIGIALTIVVGTVVGLMTAVGVYRRDGGPLVPAERDSVCFGDGIRSLGARTSAAIVPRASPISANATIDRGSEDHRTERDGDHQQSPCAPVGKRAGGNPLQTSEDAGSRLLDIDDSAERRRSIGELGDAGQFRRHCRLAARDESAGGHEQRGRIQHTSVRRPVPFGARQ